METNLFVRIATIFGQLLPWWADITDIIRQLQLKFSVNPYNLGPFPG